MKHAVQITIGLAVLSLAFAAEAQKPIVYPAKGQSAAQQSKDDAECYAWAKQNTGIDPARIASTPVPQETGPAVGGGERVRGSLRGAAGGAAIGAIAGDAGAGAGIGAIAGTMVGGRQARQQRDARNQQAYAQQQDLINTFYRGFGACMEGRGYTIK
jgi:hypothetical protein